MFAENDHRILLKQRFTRTYSIVLTEASPRPRALLFLRPAPRPSSSCTSPLAPPGFWNFTQLKVGLRPSSTTSSSSTAHQTHLSQVKLTAWVLLWRAPGCSSSSLPSFVWTPVNQRGNVWRDVMTEVTSLRMKPESFIFDTWRLSGFPSSETVKDLKNKSCPDPAGVAVPWKAAIFADNTCTLRYHYYHVTDFMIIIVTDVITITYYDGIVSYFASHCLQVIISYGLHNTSNTLSVLDSFFFITFYFVVLHWTFLHATPTFHCQAAWYVTNREHKLTDFLFSPDDTAATCGETGNLVAGW